MWTFFPISLFKRYEEVKKAGVILEVCVTSKNAVVHHLLCTLNICQGPELREALSKVEGSEERPIEEIK